MKAARIPAPGRALQRRDPAATSNCARPKPFLAGFTLPFDPPAGLDRQARCACGRCSTGPAQAAVLQARAGRARCLAYGRVVCAPGAAVCSTRSSHSVALRACAWRVDRSAVRHPWFRRGEARCERKIVRELSNVHRQPARIVSRRRPADRVIRQMRSLRQTPRPARLLALRVGHSGGGDRHIGHPAGDGRRPIARGSAGAGSSLSVQVSRRNLNLSDTANDWTAFNEGTPLFSYPVSYPCWRCLRSVSLPDRSGRGPRRPNTRFQSSRVRARCRKTR